MKTVRSLADLQSLALKSGAEVVAPGMHFNTQRLSAKAAPKIPAAAPTLALEPVAEPPPAPGYVSREAVEQMLAAHNERVMGDLQSIIQQVKGDGVAHSPGVAKEWNFHIEYDRDHAITNITAKAKP